MPESLKERELNKSFPPFPTVMYNVDRRNISPSEIVSKVKFLFLLFWNLIGKHLHFLKTIPQTETTLMRKEKSQ